MGTHEISINLLLCHPLYYYTRIVIKEKKKQKKNNKLLPLYQLIPVYRPKLIFDLTNSNLAVLTFKPVECDSWLFLCVKLVRVGSNVCECAGKAESYPRRCRCHSTQLPDKGIVERGLFKHVGPSCLFCVSGCVCNLAPFKGH